MECLSLRPSDHQESLAGGRDPEERQERRCSRPLERGSLAPSISTVRGPTKERKVEEMFYSVNVRSVKIWTAELEVKFISW